MAEKATYRIKDWEKHFECAQSRKCSGALKWITLPTAHDGGGFKRLMKQPNGTAIYGAWCLILGVAAKCPKRGVLKSSNGPLDAMDLSIKTDAPADLFAEAFRVLSDAAIGICWMESNQQNNQESGRTVVEGYHYATTTLPLSSQNGIVSATPEQLTTCVKSGSAVVERSQIATTPCHDGGLQTYKQTNKQTGDSEEKKAVASLVVDEFSHMPESMAELARAVKAGRDRAPEPSKTFQEFLATGGLSANPNA